MKVFTKGQHSLTNSSHFMVVAVTVLVTSFICHVTAQQDVVQGTCQDDTCAHGTCNTDTTSYYTCVCEDGWTGRTCDEDIDECLTGEARCRRTEVCVNSNGGFACVCRPGYDGKDCQREVSQVYGGQLSFQALNDKAQGWSRDLQELHTRAFQILAGRVENTISTVLEKKEVPHIGVTVIKFTKQTGDSTLITAKFQVSVNKAGDTDAINRALDSGFSLCQDDVCQFGTGDDVIFGAVKEEKILEDNYDLCADERNNVCHDVSTHCVTTNGTATCKCRPGYEPWSLVDNVCRDIDECGRGSEGELCGMTGGSTRCHNTAGSYYCDCPRTHTWNAQLETCVWSNICKRDEPCKNDGKCFNTVDEGEPDFFCRCTYGWTGRYCGTEDPEAQTMLWIIIGLAVGLGSLCILLLVIVICLCCKRKRSRAKKNRSVLGRHNLGSTLPPSNTVVVKATEGSVSSGYVIMDSPAPSLAEGIPGGVASDSQSEKRRDSTCGSYDLGFTPRRSVTLVTVNTIGVRKEGGGEEKPAEFYSNHFMSDRL